MLNPGSSSDGGKSKYESSVQHAMASWHQALRPDAEVSSSGGSSGSSGSGSTSVAQQRRDLLQRVLAQSEESLESEQGGARAVTGAPLLHSLTHSLTRLILHLSTRILLHFSTLPLTYSSIPSFHCYFVISTYLLCPRV
jgi:hypothetical protein